MWSMFSRSSHERAAERPIFDLRRLGSARRSENEARIRGLCASAYLGDGVALCRVLGRYKMFVDTADIGLSTHLMLDGYWEMWLTEAIAAVLKPGMTAVDVGANLGYFTLLMADCVGPSGAVHAFEPNPPIARRLANSIDVNGFLGWTHVHPEPLDAEDGREVVLCVPPGEPKNAYLSSAAEPPGDIALKTRRFDSHPELLDADVIKIDAEGAELGIWRGMSGLFDRGRPLTVFLEFAAARYADPAAFVDEIAGRGFSLAEVVPAEGIRPRTREQILSAPPQVDQMLMLRR